MATTMAKIFISYGRASKDAVQQLAQDLKDDDQDVWFDQQLTGGQKWWDNILARIRECEIFVAALTPNFLESRACQREMKYAGDLQKPFLPVRLSDKVSPDSLPPNLGELQWVDYSLRSVEALKSLQRTLRHMPEAPAPPDPLPNPPPVPISYLSSLRAKIETDAQLQLQDQIELVFELRQQFRKAEPSEELLDLLQRLKSRDDLLARVGLDVEHLEREIKGSRSDTESVAPHLIPQAGEPPIVEGTARPSRPTIAGTAAGPTGPQPPRSANVVGGPTEATKVSDEHRKTRSLSPALALSALGAVLILGSVSIGYFYLRPAPTAAPPPTPSPPVVNSPVIPIPTTPSSTSTPQPPPVVVPVETPLPSFPLFCQGPLTTGPRSPPPSGPTSTRYKWASKGAVAENPGPGECAWADRGPRGVEIVNGEGNVICDYSGNLAGLLAGKYLEIYVHRDPAENNCMRLTRYVGLVNPPFSSAPMLPPEPSPNTAKPGSEFTDCADGCPAMIVVPAGKFMMGSPENEPGRSDREGPQREVSIAKPFAVSKYEVTFAEWDACTAAGACPQANDESGRGQMPVVNVSWHYAKQYVGWLSRFAGKDYRLLTEAEWEYAARAGTTTAYFWGEAIGNNNANCSGCGSEWDNKQTAPVGSFQPNAFGLYDMAGNVWEWVEDVWHESYEGAPTDGSAWLQGGDPSVRVARSGSWLFTSQYLRAASRLRASTNVRRGGLGFRVARTLTP
jgi:formylglycine-generating enzyme required for sulfatase activity